MHENLTLDALRALVRGYERPQRRESSQAEAIDRRGATTNVEGITNNSMELLTSPIRDKRHEHRGAATSEQEAPAAQATPLHSRRQGDHSDTAWSEPDISLPDATTPPHQGGTLLQQAADTLSILAARADQLAVDGLNEQALDRVERVLNEIRRSFARRTVAPPAATD